MRDAPAKTISMREAAYLRDRRPLCLLCGFGAQGFELAVERVSFAHKHIPPPLGALDAGCAEHVQELGSGVRGQLLEVLAHRVEHGLARGHHVVADLLLLIERIALRRVQAEVRSEVGHVLGLGELGHLGFVHLFISFRAPGTAVGAPGVLQIPLQIIRKGAFSSEVKWCADFSDKLLLTCGFVVFRGRV